MERDILAGEGLGGGGGGFIRSHIFPGGPSCRTSSLARGLPCRALSLPAPCPQMYWVQYRWSLVHLGVLLGSVVAFFLSAFVVSSELAISRDQILRRAAWLALLLRPLVPWSLGPLVPWSARPLIHSSGGYFSRTREGWYRIVPLPSGVHKRVHSQAARRRIEGLSGWAACRKMVNDHSLQRRGVSLGLKRRAGPRAPGVPDVLDIAGMAAFACRGPAA